MLFQPYDISPQKGEGPVCEQHVICRIYHGIVKTGSVHKLDDAIFARKMVWIVIIPCYVLSTIGYASHLSGVDLCSRGNGWCVAFGFCPQAERCIHIMSNV